MVNEYLMDTGKIVSLAERDFGFIACPGKKEHLYFHADALNGITFKELVIGDTLSFEVTESLKGPYATQVSKVS